jgi:hypothetical protein
VQHRGADRNEKGVKVNPLRRTAFVVGLLFIIWELSLGIYLMVKGFRPPPITEGLPAGGSV